MLRFAAVAILAITTTVSADELPKGAADNWHQWRGPNADGSAPTSDPPTKWDAKTNIAWKTELPGRGNSTPIIWGDRVFLLSAIKTDRVAKENELPKLDPKFEVKTKPPINFYKFVVLCYDRTNGKKLWEQVAAEAVPHEGHHESHGYAGGSPTTDGKFLYVSFGSFGTYCYDLDGHLKWSRTDLGRIHSRYGWGEAVTPVVSGTSLILNHDQEADSRLICLDTGTGKTKWDVKRDERSTWATPLLVDHGGKMQVVTNGTTRIRGYDFATGELVWQCAGMTVNPIPSPVRYGDSAICMSGYGGAAAVSIPLSSRGDLGKEGVVNWRYAAGTPYVPSPVLVGDNIAFTQANESLLTVLDAKTGKVVLDKERLPQVKGFFASPITAADRVYFVDRSGTTVVIKIGETMDVLSVNKLDDPIDASPVAVGKQLFLRGQKYLYCIETK